MEEECPRSKESPLKEIKMLTAICRWGKQRSKLPKLLVKKKKPIQRTTIS